MTIAIGMLCGYGAIVAADRRRALSDGTSTFENKIVKFNGASISFAIADSSQDADAAKTLVRTISHRLGTSSILGWGDVEQLITKAMTEWYVPYTEAPSTKLIAGIMLKGFGVQLYSCEPPNTVLPHSEGYISAGMGASVTDPLNSVLFGHAPQSRHPQAVLRQIAYLMFRAKKDNAWCGGLTDAVYLDLKSEQAEWVSIPDMRQAEEASFQLDLVLNSAASAMLGYPEDYLEHNARGVENSILTCKKIRDVVFHDVCDKKIGS